jgi:predicted NAD-dependent protein-ADP-ribosyltransferase YbiA (DUF1768 family)
MLKYDCVRELPEKLTTSYIYLSSMQSIHLRKLSLSEESRTFCAYVATVVPCWVPHKPIASAMGYSLDAIERAELRYGYYVWATEFENVHSTWDFGEPILHIDGKKFRDSEHYYQSKKPVPWNTATWNAEKIDVMTRGVFEKMLQSLEARSLLLSTWNHPLVSIKPDLFWGFYGNSDDNASRSVNALAIILTTLRGSFRQICLGVADNVRKQIYPIDLKGV